MDPEVVDRLTMSHTATVGDDSYADDTGSSAENVAMEDLFEKYLALEDSFRQAAALDDETHQGL